jgi:hypothetical protein
VWHLDPAVIRLPEAALPLTSLSTLDDEVVVEALQLLYGWAHAEAPGPVASTQTPRDVIVREILPRLRRESAVIAIHDGRTDGVGALAEFGGESLGLLSGVAPGIPDRVGLARALLARLLPAADRPVQVEVTGGDPLAAVLATVPARQLADRVVVHEKRA